MFKTKQRKLNNDSISIKLGGLKLIPSDTVKYLGLHLGKYLSWDIQINQLSNKLCRVDGILSDLRHFVPKQTLIFIILLNILFTFTIWLSGVVTN